MIGILWLFLQSAASHLLYLALRLETGSFPKPLSAKEEQAAFAAMRAGDAAARETLILPQPAASGTHCKKVLYRFRRAG